MTLPAYCTREDVAGVLDVAPSVRLHRQIDRLIGTASRDVESLTRRARFYPEVTTLRFDWPTRASRSSWRLWLDANDLLSVSALVSGGDTIAASGYLLSPAQYGPPYSSIELDRSATPGGWSAGDTSQRSIAVTGTWGYTDATTSAGELAAQVATTTETTIDVTGAAAAAVGVGDLVTIGAERMVVTGRAQLATGQTLQANLAALVSATSVAVSDGSEFTPGEVLLIGAERLSVDDVAGNTLVVTRAASGTVLGAHTAGATIYAPRRLTVERGALGTTAATHLAAAAVARLAVPDPIRQLAIAEAVVALQREQTGYARTIGSGEGTRAAPGGDLRDRRDQVRARYGRVARHRAV